MEIEKNAIENYAKNLEFLKTHSPILHSKLIVLENGLNTGLIPSKFELEYRDNKYFDIYNVENNSWYYGKDSSEYSKEITKNINLDVTVNSFKTFYEFHYENGVIDKVKDASIFSSAVFGNAPIIDYVNNNIPSQKFFRQMFLYMVFGVGLGLHLPLIQKNVSAKLYLIVEAQLEIFRLSLFTISYEELAKKAQIIFFVGYDKDIFSIRFRELHDKAYIYNQYIKFFLFSKTSEIYFEGMQSMLSSQSHTMFSYDRQLQSLTLTSEYSQNDYNFIKVNERVNLKFENNAPILILAGGPSFKKNIKFIKENQQKFIIITIFSLIKILEENGISPDIITNYDESDVYTKFINEVYELTGNKNYFDDKIVIFGSHVSKKVVNMIPKDNIYFFNAMFSIKKNLGTITGPSIGEMTYALGLIFAPKNIYLLGLDLAFDPLTGKSHFEGYNEASQFKVDRDASVETFSLRKNVMIVKGNFRDEVETTAVFNISIKQLDVFTKLYNPDNKIKIYNLSDGAYFKDIEALNIESIDISNYKDIDKINLEKEIKKVLNTISSNKFSEEDIEFIQEKFGDAKRLKEVINDLLLGRKHSSIDKYLICLENLDIELENKDYKCNDLKAIILNYCRYNLPYIFYFLNLKNLDNPKSHIKKLNKSLHIQITKIIDVYIKMLEQNLSKKSSS